MHPQRTTGGITKTELAMVALFLQRYVVWCVRSRLQGSALDACSLLAELARRR
jgi:hypothetical protein